MNTILDEVRELGNPPRLYPVLCQTCQWYTEDGLRTSCCIDPVPILLADVSRPVIKLVDATRHGSAFKACSKWENVDG